MIRIYFLHLLAFIIAWTGCSGFVMSQEDRTKDRADEEIRDDEDRDDEDRDDEDRDDEDREQSPADLLEKLEHETANLARQKKKLEQRLKNVARRSKLIAEATALQKRMVKLSEEFEKAEDDEDEEKAEALIEEIEITGFKVEVRLEEAELLGGIQELREIEADATESRRHTRRQVARWLIARHEAVIKTGKKLVAAVEGEKEDDIEGIEGEIEQQFAAIDRGWRAIELDQELFEVAQEGDDGAEEELSQELKAVLKRLGLDQSRKSLGPPENTPSKKSQPAPRR